MQIISLVSSHHGTGTTTVAVNAAKGLQQRGYRVIIHSVGGNSDLYDWLDLPPIDDTTDLNSTNKDSRPGLILNSAMGIDVFLADLPRSDVNYYTTVSSYLDSRGYDYLILDTGSPQENLKIGTALADLIIACTDLVDPDEPQHLAHLNKLIEDSSGYQKVINLVVPCKVDSNVWNHSQVLFAIADRMGYENIADIIPACDRIRLLPSDHKHVWDLPYKNLHCVFNSLISRLEIN